MKWIALILLVSLVRGIIFPDYRFGPNLIIIPFVTPVIFAALAAYVSATGRLSKLSAGITSLFAIYLSEVVGTIVYGYSTGWHNVTQDVETQAIIQLTVIVQTVVYLVTLPVVYKVLSSRYNKASKPTP